MGYALYGDAGQSSTVDFDKRLKYLTGGGNNLLSSRMGARIKFSEYRGDPNGNVSFYHVAKSGLLTLPSVSPPNVAQGFFNNEGDSDGNYRLGMMVWRVNDYFVPGLALRMAQKFVTPNDAPPSLLLKPDLPEQGISQEFRIDLQTNDGPRRIPIDLYGQAIVNYRGPNSTFPNVSMVDVLSNSDTLEYTQVESTGALKKFQAYKKEFFKDALVIFGLTAVGIYDIRPRPFDPVATGVENHATILDNLIADDFIVRPTTELLMIMMIAILFASLLFGVIITKLDAKFGALFAFASLGGLLYFDQFYLFNKHRIFFSGHLQAIQFLLQYIGITVLKYMQEENEKKFIRSAFNKYVSPAVIDTMLKDPGKLKLGGDKKELSILFSDIRGFTELSERVDVKALTQFLNEYLGSMTEILQANQGTLDKYIGDAVMGFWGAPVDTPNHASLAVKTAVEMVAKLDELNANFKKAYGFEIDIGIGINSGAVSVGNFGSSKVFEYTVIGDNVNLASRLEGINKYYGTHVIISEMTYSLLKSSEFLCREVDTVKVKGKQKPVKIYEVFPDNAAHQPLKSVLKPFNEGLMHYYARQWDKAMSVFQNVLATRNNDRPTLELIDRCKHYMGNPPSVDWDGSWEMHSK